MESIEKKLAVLCRIAEVFNENQVRWAVGASMLLYFKGLTDDVHDIDIMADEKDVETIKAVLMPLGKMQTPDPDAGYATKHFMEFRIEGVDVDVIAGFTVISGEKEYYLPLKEEDIVDHTVINGITIPLHSLKEWKRYYEWMGRPEKAAMIGDRT